MGVSFYGFLPCGSGCAKIGKELLGDSAAGRDAGEMKEKGEAGVDRADIE